jgi:prepilin-type N-terminal cleavage/methylation domain-containing protein
VSLGFSLLEMVIALFIVSLLFGLAIMATRNFFGDEELRSAAREVALLAKNARQDALRENRPYEILVQKDRLVLRPAEQESSLPPEPGPKNEQTAEREPVEYILPDRVKMKVKVWGSQDWKKTEETVWHFSASGLCAPNSFHLERGTSWMQMTFNPLTANKQHEEWYLP